MLRFDSIPPTPDTTFISGAYVNGLRSADITYLDHDQVYAGLASAEAERLVEHCGGELSSGERLAFANRILSLTRDPENAAIVKTFGEGFARAITTTRSENLMPYLLGHSLGEAKDV